MNTKKRRGGISRYKGVDWSKRSQKWRARATVKGKTHHLGYFEIEVEAARAYNEAATRLFGEFARVNIID